MNGRVGVSGTRGSRGTRGWHRCLTTLLIGVSGLLFLVAAYAPSAAVALTGTKLSIAVNPSRATVEQKAKVTGVLRTTSGKAISKQKVRLERYSNRSWKAVRTCSTNGSGKVTVEVQPAEKTKYRYRFLATKSYAKATSVTKEVQGYKIPNQTVKGTGPKTVSIQLERGLSVFDVHMGKASKSVVSLLDGKSAMVAALGAGQGAYTLSQAVRVPVATKYLLAVVADGAWDVVVRQPRQLSASAPTTLKGTGTKVTRLFSLKKGECEVSWTQQGLYPLAFILLDRDGNRVKGGSCTWAALPKGSATITVPEEGQYVLQVVSTSSWSVSFKQSSK